MSRGKSYRNKNGRTDHYDERGRKTGTSYEVSGGRKVIHYDKNGKRTGTSYRNSYGDRYTNYDANGKKTGVSYKNPYGSTVTHYDDSGKKTGYSDVNGHRDPTHSSPSGGASSSNEGEVILVGCLFFFIFIIWAFFEIFY